MVETTPRPDWSPLPRPGVQGVECRVHLRRKGLLIAQLRFAENAFIDEHDAPYEIDVICLSGSGFVSVDGQAEAFEAGQRIAWPANKQHKLWTQDSRMETLMVERYGEANRAESGNFRAD